MRFDHDECAFLHVEDAITTLGPRGSNDDISFGYDPKTGNVSLYCRNLPDVAGLWYNSINSACAHLRDRGVTVCESAERMIEDAIGRSAFRASVWVTRLFCEHGMKTLGSKD